MVRAAKGFRSGTRRKLKAGLRSKFKVEDYIKEFKAGDKVIITINPSSSRGMPHPRFKGSVGEIEKVSGSSYTVRIKTGRGFKKVTSKPEHLKKA
jgi:large subunit ribosomal protein L21e